jgi:hypothetical protein
MTLLNNPSSPPSVASSTVSNLAVVGKVVWIKGSFVAIGPDSKQRELNKTDPIYLHDTLETNANTEAQIVFSDDTLMTFRPVSKFYIDTYLYDNSKAHKGSVGKYVMNLLEGGFRTITGAIAKSNPTDYQVNTPVATIGVRGTDYAVVLQNGSLLMAFYQGSPCITSGSQTICLDKKTPYAKVPFAHSPPMPLIKQPAVFQQQTPIVNVEYIALGGVVSSPGGGNPPAGGGSAATDVTTPNDQTVNTTGILNNFCIQ